MNKWIDIILLLPSSGDNSYTNTAHVNQIDAWLRAEHKKDNPIQTGGGFYSAETPAGETIVEGAWCATIDEKHYDGLMVKLHNADWIKKEHVLILVRKDATASWEVVK